MQPKQAFLDINSKFNAQYNVNEKLVNVFKLAEQAHKDNFDSVISVYAYNDPTEFSAYSGDLDDVVKRSTLAIQLYGASNWSDDHFLMIGQANYLKGDYDKASSSFKYITTEFKDGVDYVRVMKGLGKRVRKYARAKKRKPKAQVKIVTKPDGTKSLEKQDVRPSRSLFMHTPARSEALIWLIKTYTRERKFEQASSVVTYTRGDNLFYKNYDADLDLADADLRVSSKDYAGAIKPLESYLEAKKIRKRKKRKVRPLFSLAQCYEAIGNSSKAIDNYKLVLKSHPNYDMEFYAKIKMAKLGRGSGAGNAQIRSLLAKMARDGKYKDYWDQIYYELAMISLSENNRKEATKFFHQSVDNSISNDNQKALSYLQLAEIQYDEMVYDSAKFYYDSTLAFLSKTHPRYDELDLKNKMLGNLLQQLAIIAEEDSLQHLASLSESERLKVVKGALDKEEKEKQDKKEKEEASKSGSTPQPITQPDNSKQSSSSGPGLSWYFYNTAARASGYNEFIKRWGKRKLEENWRRKNKSSSSDEEQATKDTSATVAVDSVGKETANTDEEKMMASIPTTPEKLSASIDKITEAYYTAGTIYKDGLENYPKASDMFETLNSKYPKNKLLLESYYSLYLIALRQNDQGKTELYKSKILTEFPESIIAKVLRDPNYLNEATQKGKAAENYYQLAYENYAGGRLDSAWYQCEMSDVVLKPNPLSDKFQLLQALILAKQNRLHDYVQALNKIINRANDPAIKSAATELLALLNKSALPQADLSRDTARRDSLNTVFAPMQTSQPGTVDSSLLKQLNDARQKAEGSKPQAKADSVSNKEVKPVETKKDTANIEPLVISEDTTSPYKRSDDAAHYFVIYFKDPTVQQSIIMSTMAKVNAYNSTQFESKKLQTKQVIIDSKNKLLAVRQFKTKEETMSYFNIVKSQSQLFSDLKPDQYAITAISTINFSVLISEKDVDAYNKFFRRVYQ
ncbi:MAG: tetratricopeptide repeat protein [Bacteroidetes bacterium]|nr:tetratricopeptide repeat protein [Bacteroidota bacterium]